MHAIAWVTSDIGRDLTAAVVTIGLALLGALALWELASLYMESYVSRVELNRESEEKRARIRTMMPLARNVLLFVLVAVVGLIVLAQLGINIAPLLAGAGIVGLAVGFGAQKMVQDVFTGIFVFLEASVAVGDVVELGGHSGVVEAMSIRSIRLRDLEGNVYTIPFSAVSTVMNQTKGHSYYLFDIGVGYRENTDRVVATMREVGDSLRNDKEYGSAILEPLEVLGLDRFADSAVMIKARIKTLPGRQWMVGREFNRRLKLRFDDLGIEIPFPQRTITFAGAIPFAAEPKASQ
jgi:small conductance mechanosensitive channel